MIEQVGTIVDTRRYLALEEGRLPDTLVQALRNTERQGNPWGQPRHLRAAWTAGTGSSTGSCSSPSSA